MKQLFVSLLGSALAEPLFFHAALLRRLKHPGEPFTQGLELADEQTLIETSGAFPPGTSSAIRAPTETMRHRGKSMKIDEEWPTTAQNVGKTGDAWRFRGFLDLQDGREKQSAQSSLSGTFAEGVARVDDGWLVSTYDSHKVRS